MRDFLSELRRRNVVRIGLLYGVSSWVLLQVADVLTGLLGLPDWTLRLVGLLLLLGFPLALIFAWVYELTPEGLKRERDVDRSQSITPRTGQRLNIVIATLLAIAVTLLVLQQFARSPGEDVLAPGAEVAANVGPIDAPGAVAGDKALSIAVLPFVNMSGDPDNEYFSDGLSEELLNVLARVPGLRVAARTSSFHFKDKTGDVAEIGRQLGVANVLEGSVRKAGDTVRVTVQLINVEDGFHLWSDTYDRELDDIFAIQDDIAGHVVDALTEALLGANAVAVEAKESSIGSQSLGTDNFLAYDRFLLARQYYNRGSFESLATAKSYYLEAIELDPDFREAWRDYARAVFKQWNTGSISPSRAVHEMSEAVDRVAAIDAAAGERRGDRLALEAEVTIVEQSAKPMSAADWEQVAEVARGKLEEARRLSPNDSKIYASLAISYETLGQYEAALEVLQQARVIDPLSVEIAGRLASLYAFSLNRPDLALEEARRIQRIEPSNPDGYSREAAIHQRSGNLPASLRARKKSIELDPDDHELRAWLSQIYLAVGLVEPARQAVEAAESIGPGEPLTLVARALFEYYVGNDDAALAIATRVLEGKQAGRHGSEFWFSVLVIYDAFQNGHYDRMLEIADGMVGPVDLDEPVLDNEYGAFASLVYRVPALIGQGRTAQATRLIEAIARCFEECPDPRQDWERLHDAALIEFYAGDREQALAMYADMIDQSPVFIDWWFVLDRDPMRDDIHRAPVVAAAMDRFRSRVDAVRAEIRRAETEGDGAMPGEPEVVGQARSMLSEKLSVPAQSIRLEILESVTWPDGSIGCPQPDMIYTQALEPGIRIVFSAAGVEYHYHARDGGTPFFCETPGKALPHD
jgi:TolB-like protein/Flp pilus assembly protein TadD